MNLTAFQDALNARGAEVAAFFAALPARDLTHAAPERWSAAQHLDHLIRSHKLLALALSMPRDRFGWGQRTPPGSRSADAGGLPRRTARGRESLRALPA